MTNIITESELDGYEVYYSLDDFEDTIRNYVIDNGRFVKKNHSILKDATKTNIQEKESTSTKKDDGPSFKYLLEALRATTDDTEKFSEMKKLVTDFQPHRVSKWFSENRIGQAELYDHLERVLDTMRSEEPKAWRPYISVTTLKDWNKRGLWPFHNKVSKRDVPNYYNIIKHPMHLGEMARKLKSWQYNSKKEFAHDLLLIWENCLFFNSMPESMYHKAGLALQKKSKQLIETIPDIAITTVKQPGEADSSKEVPPLSTENLASENPTLSATDSASSLLEPASGVVGASRDEESVSEGVKPDEQAEDVVVVDGTAFHDAVEDASKHNPSIPDSTDHSIDHSGTQPPYLLEAAELFEEYCTKSSHVRTGEEMAEYLARTPALPEWKLSDAVLPEIDSRFSRPPGDSAVMKPVTTVPGDPALSIYVTAANVAAVQYFNYRIQRLVQHNWETDIDPPLGAIELPSVPKLLPDYEHSERLRRGTCFAAIKQVAALITRHAGFGGADSFGLAVVSELLHTALFNLCRLLQSFLFSSNRPKFSDGLELLDCLLGQANVDADGLQNYIQREVIRYCQQMLDLRLKLEVALRIATHRASELSQQKAQFSVTELSSRGSEAESELAISECLSSIDSTGIIGQKLSNLISERLSQRGTPHVHVKAASQAQEKSSGYATVNLADAPFPAVLSSEISYATQYLDKIKAGDTELPERPPKIIGILIPFFQAKLDEDDLRDDESKGRSKQQRDKRAQLLKQAAYAARNKRLPMAFGAGGTSVKTKKAKGTKHSKKAA